MWSAFLCQCDIPPVQLPGMLIPIVCRGSTFFFLISLCFSRCCCCTVRRTETMRKPWLTILALLVGVQAIDIDLDDPGECEIGASGERSGWD